MASLPQLGSTSATDLVWLQTGFLGDLVLTTAAMAAAAEAWPTVRQHLITTPVGAAALKDSSLLDSLIVFDKGRQSLAASFGGVRRKLALKGRGVLLQAHRSFRSSLLARYLGLPTISYREASLSWLAARRVDRVGVWHEAGRIGLLLEPLGLPREALIASRPRLDALPLDPAISWQAEFGDSDLPLVGLAPGSVWPTKRWTMEGFCELAQRLVHTSRVGLLLLGSEAERSLTEAIALRFSDKSPVWNLAGRTSLDDLRRIMPRLSLLVANDSSPIHYASAFAVPTVAIFGATVPAMGFAPLAAGSICVGKDLSCRPCSDHGPLRCPLGHFDCMRKITADEVYAACLKALGT